MKHFASDPKPSPTYTPDEQKRRDAAKKAALAYHGIEEQEPEPTFDLLEKHPSDYKREAYERSMENSQAGLEFSKRELNIAEEELGLLEREEQIVDQVDDLVARLSNRRRSREDPQSRVERVIAGSLAEAGIHSDDEAYAEWARKASGTEEEILTSFNGWLRGRATRDVTKATKQDFAVTRSSAVGGGPAVPSTSSGDVDEITAELDQLQRSGNLTSPANRARRAELRRILAEQTAQRPDIR
jgi:hypothetical protein